MSVCVLPNPNKPSVRSYRLLLLEKKLFTRPLCGVETRKLGEEQLCVSLKKVRCVKLSFWTLSVTLCEVKGVSGQFVRQFVKGAQQQQ